MRRSFVVGVAVLAVGAYLGYSVWANNQSSAHRVSRQPRDRGVHAGAQEDAQRRRDADAPGAGARRSPVASDDAIEQYQAGPQAQQGVGPGAVGHRLRADEAEGLEGRRGVLQARHRADRGQDARRCRAAARARSPTTTSASPAWSRRTTRERRATSRKRCDMRRDASDTSYALSVVLRRSSTSTTASARCSSTRCSSTPTCPRRTTTTGCCCSRTARRRRGRRALPHLSRRGSVQAGAQGPAREARNGERAPCRGQQARVDGRQRGAGRGARRGRTRSRSRSSRSCSWASSTRRLKKRKKAAETYQKILVIDPENKAAIAGLKRVKNGS